MFTVKSPSSNCSRINLSKETSSKTLGPWAALSAGPAQPLPAHHPQRVWFDTGPRFPAAPSSLVRAGPSAPLCSWPHSHEHGAADEEEEVKAAVISEEGVPDTDDIRQQELLGQQQRQPAEGKELRLDVLLLLGRQRRTVGARIHVGW